MVIAVIGSLAMMHHVGYTRKPSDIDYVGDYDELIRHLKTKEIRSLFPIDMGKKIVAKADYIYECEITWPGSTSEALFNLIINDRGTYLSHVTDQAFAYPSLNLLYMLKMTHRYRKNSPHFLKNMADIHLLRSRGAVIEEAHKEFFKLREKATYDYGHPKLNQSKKDFFTDSVPYKYDHDSIHEAVKLLEKPAYNFYKPDESEVLTSKAMFFEAGGDVRLAGVYEEACVLALERSQIPYPETPLERSFDMALEKVCTSITSGWFREYAWEHYYDVKKLYYSMVAEGNDYLTLFNRGLKNNTVKPFEGGSMM